MNNSSKGKQHDILHRFIEESNRMISTLQRYKKFPRNEHFYFFFQIFSIPYRYRQVFYFLFLLLLFFGKNLKEKKNEKRRKNRAYLNTSESLMQLHRVWTNHVCETLVRINKHLSLLNKTKSSMYISTGYPHAIHEKNFIYINFYRSFLFATPRAFKFTRDFIIRCEKYRACRK